MSLREVGPSEKQTTNQSEFAQFSTIENKQWAVCLNRLIQPIDQLHLFLCLSSFRKYLNQIWIGARGNIWLVRPKSDQAGGGALIVIWRSMRLFRADARLRKFQAKILARLVPGRAFWLNTKELKRVSWDICNDEACCWRRWLIACVCMFASGAASDDDNAEEKRWGGNDDGNSILLLMSLSLFPTINYACWLTCKRYFADSTFWCVLELDEINYCLLTFLFKFSYVSFLVVIMAAGYEQKESWRRN